MRRLRQRTAECALGQFDLEVVVASPYGDLVGLLRAGGGDT